MIDTHIVIPALVSLGSIAFSVTVAAIDPSLYATATALVIGAGVAGTIQIINAVSAARERRVAQESALASLVKSAEVNARKNEEILNRAEVIQSTTNGTNSHLQNTLAVMRKEMEGMQRLMDQMEKEKQATAAMRVVTDLQKVSAEVAKPEIEPSALDKIEVNTNETAKNTARTEDKIDKL